MKGKNDMNVLIIGDSISHFYRESVKEQLGEEYNVYYPMENCRFASYVLNSLRYWLPEFPKPDIIHFNAGLWDLAILYKEDGCFTPKEVYVYYMRKILRELKKTGAKIIFATSTPVSDEKRFLDGPAPPANRNEDIIAYNEAVTEIYREEGIEINDLFSLVYPEKEKYISEDMVHPNEDGVKLLADAVTKAIKNLGEVHNTSSVKTHKIERPDEKTIQ